MAQEWDKEEEWDKAKEWDRAKEWDSTEMKIWMAAKKGKEMEILMK